MIGIQKIKIKKNIERITRNNQSCIMTRYNFFINFCNFVYILCPFLMTIWFAVTDTL